MYYIDDQQPHFSIKFQFLFSFNFIWKFIFTLFYFYFFFVFSIFASVLVLLEILLLFVGLPHFVKIHKANAKARECKMSNCSKKYCYRCRPYRLKGLFGYLPFSVRGVFKWNRKKIHALIKAVQIYFLFLFFVLRFYVKLFFFYCDRTIHNNIIRRNKTYMARQALVYLYHYLYYLLFVP